MALLNTPAESLLTTAVSDAIIRLHNNPVFTGREKHKSEAYRIEHRNNYQKLEAWRQRLQDLAQERQPAKWNSNKELYAQHNPEPTDLENAYL